MKNNDKLQRQIQKVELDEDAKVTAAITFAENIQVKDIPEAEEQTETVQDVAEAIVDDEPLVLQNTYAIKAQHAPHKDFVNAMRKLTKYAMEIAEIEVEDQSEYWVSAFAIAGDMALKQSRIVLTVCHHVQRTDKVIKFNTPQVTMYGKSDYDKAQHLTKAVEDVITEAWAYIGGKYAEKGQLPLFERGLRVSKKEAA